MMLLCLLLMIWIIFVFFFFKQMTAYDLRISDWSSDVCSSDLVAAKISLPKPVQGDQRRGRIAGPASQAAARRSTLFVTNLGALRCAGSFLQRTRRAQHQNILCRQPWQPYSGIKFNFAIPAQIKA